MKNLQTKLLKETINFVEEFAKKFSDKKLIIRPHPSESHKIWEDLLTNIKMLKQFMMKRALAVGC